MLRLRWQIRKVSMFLIQIILLKWIGYMMIGGGTDTIEDAKKVGPVY